MSAQVATGITSIISASAGAIALVLHALTYYRTSGKAQDNSKPVTTAFTRPGS